MITELGKRCQEMARIEDFASFKVGASGGIRQPTDSSLKLFLSVFASFKKSSYGHVEHRLASLMLYFEA